MRTTTPRDRRHRAIAIAFLLIAAVMAVVWLAGCGRALAQAPPSFAPVTGYTDCGFDGALVMLNTTVQYDPLVPETGTARWGPCSGRSGSIAGCNDNELNRWGEKRCIATESEEAVIKEALRWEISGSCSPPRDTPYPSKQLVEDYGKVVGAYSGRNGLRTRWEAACFARPTPTPPPTPTPLPQPTPTIAPTPAPIQIPPSPPTDGNCRAVGCNPPIPQATPTVTPAPQCKQCDQYEAMPARHRETYLSAPYWKRDANGKLRRDRQQRLDEANAWTRAHPKTWYVPAQTTSSVIGERLGTCDDAETVELRELCLTLTREPVRVEASP